jgi:outer membrane protein assembly factor BamD
MKRHLLIFLLLASLVTPAQALLNFRDRKAEPTPQEQTLASQEFYEKALAADRAGRERQALRLYRKIFKRYPASDFTAQSLFNSGVILYERRSWRKAFSAFQVILALHPDFPRFNDIVDYQFKIALALAEGENVRLLFVIPYKAMNRSIDYFEVIVRNAPYSEAAPLALMNVALMHQYKGQTAEAIDALDRLINLYPSSLIADDAYLSLAETFADLVQGPDYDQGATREAISYFEDFLILFSNSVDAARAEEGLAEMEDVYARSKLTIGTYYFRYRGWFQAAEIFFNETITIAPDSPSAATARDYLARIEAIRSNQAPPDPSPEAKADRRKEQSFIRRWLGRIF